MNEKVAHEVPPEKIVRRRPVSSRSYSQYADEDDTYGPAIRLHRTIRQQPSPGESSSSQPNNTAAHQNTMDRLKSNPKGKAPASSPSNKPNPARTPSARTPIEQLVLTRAQAVGIGNANLTPLQLKNLASVLTKWAVSREEHPPYPYRDFGTEHDIDIFNQIFTRWRPFPLASEAREYLKRTVPDLPKRANWNWKRQQGDRDTLTTLHGSLTETILGPGVAPRAKKGLRLNGGAFKTRKAGATSVPSGDADDDRGRRSGAPSPVAPPTNGCSENRHRARVDSDSSMETWFPGRAREGRSDGGA
ncbi:hypothetical protein BT63DRAFT_430451 [Microthyrium microscopicum]|uniref:Uncharacterized protein n=1 Tax=Microthyrium microscopicum TaxID=703497 RepID=A0A6A6TU22_9PEZI|nr:hypothetical protein BT63DRAFT_430451 [Microthyrium microscopicum]